MLKQRFVLTCVFFASIMISLIIAQDTGSEEGYGKSLDQMTKEDFREYYRLYHSRKPKKIDKTNKKAEEVVKNQNKLQKMTEAKPLPSNMIFPAEFEEVKAILISWPYLLDSLDLGNNSEFSEIYSKLAKTIDDNVEVWINVFKAKDSTAIINFMSQKNMPLKRARFFVNKGDSYWYRDCGPVAFYYGTQDSIGFIDFEYYTGREFDNVIPIKIGEKMGYPVFTTQIEFEGGNVILDGCGTLFTSDEVFNKNGDQEGMDGEKDPLTKKQVQDSLKNLLNLKDLLVLPKLKYDGGTGHIDLYADLLDENSFVFSQMPTEMNKLTDYKIVNDNITKILAFAPSDGRKFRKSIIPFPRKKDGTGSSAWYSSDIDYMMYTRTYSNHVFVNKTIIQPVYGELTSEYIKKDLDSIKTKYPGYNIVPIDMRAFDGQGGAIHCITKEIPADNPLRIIHAPVEKNLEYKSSYPITTKIHNKSGILKAACKWRYKGSTTWNTESLIASNNEVFTGNMINSKNNGTIEYYMEATSNNGKTMTKPMTAPDGYYSFNFEGGTTFCLNSMLSKGKMIELVQKQSLNKVYLKTNQIYSDLELNLFTIAGKAIGSYYLNAKNGTNQIEINTSLINSGFLIAVLKSKDGIILKEKITIIR